MRPHEERLMNEAVELGHKIRKLTAFFETETFRRMPLIDADLLKQQHTHMVNYFAVMQRRIDRIGTAQEGA